MKNLKDTIVEAIVKHNIKKSQEIIPLKNIHNYNNTNIDNNYEYAVDKYLGENIYNYIEFIYGKITEENLYSKIRSFVHDYYKNGFLEHPDVKNWKYYDKFENIAYDISTHIIEGISYKTDDIKAIQCALINRFPIGFYKYINMVFEVDSKIDKFDYKDSK